LYRRTLFNTPVVTRIFYFVSLLGLRAAGWRIKGTPPRKSRFVLIAYPHTSNWDAPFTLAICLVYRLKLLWLCKASLFRGPMGPVMKWLGAIPVPLGQSQNLVLQTIDAFAHEDELIIMIAPEGDRSYVHRWKTGFYHIAAGAGVPIVLGYLDFAKKEGGYLKSYYPTGDVDKDMALIQAEYEGMKGKYPDQSA
jgi:1-acyl-sn-glycerol-3-phosphate acyltransferase